MQTHTYVASLRCVLQRTGVQVPAWACGAFVCQDPATLEAAPLQMVGGALPSALWPPPVSASCTGSVGSSFSSSLAFHFSGHGEKSAIARNAAARYLSILTEGASASGSITHISVFVNVAEERLGLGTDYAYEISVKANEVQVRAHSPFGVAYGLETLSQFIVRGDNGAAALQWRRG